MLKQKGNEMNKQAAINTALILAAFVMTALGFYGMMLIDAMYTITVLAIFGVVFLVKSIYDIEKGRIESLGRLENIDRKYP